MPATYAVFELSIDRRLGNELEIAATYIDSQDIERRAGPAVLELDSARLAATDDLHDPDAYGTALANAVFASTDIRRLFERAHHEAQRTDDTLRIRCVIGDRANELHALDWERLAGPETGDPLFRGGDMPFSRYLNSLDWRRAPATPPPVPTALIVVANPRDLSDFAGPAFATPQPIDVDAEFERAHRVLTTWKLDRLVAPGSATLDAIVEKLDAGPDVLYLVCHGLADGDKAVLLLEHEDNTAHQVRAIELVNRIVQLGRAPRLVVLASCQSASGTNDAIDPGRAVRWRLGPELCRAGVPAVLAMQGNLTQDTAAEFLPVFFEGASRHGQLDRAMTEARGRVRDRPDWSCPTLFMRLRSGRLWARARADTAFERWPALLRAIEAKKCLPIVGPRASELLLGAQRDIARELAVEHGFPLAPYQADDLVQVAHYVQVRQGRDVLRSDVRRLLRKSLNDRYGELLDGELDDEGLDDALAAAARHLASNEINEPHEVIARLPFPLYITTEPTDLLAQAIESARRTPVRAFYRWRLTDPTDQMYPIPIEWPDDPLVGNEGYEVPDDDHAVVYHLFGHMGIQWSVALTEDDYFEFLIGVDSSRDSRSPLHPYVVRALTQHTILFIGFRMEDWDFRVLLRTIARLPGKRRLDIPHVAVQLDPEEDRTVAPDRARDYLRDFFGKANISIYWGSSDLFADQLLARAGAAGLVVRG